MTRAYNEVYVSDAKRNLAMMFDYMINDFGMYPNTAAEVFVISGYAAMFEIGNPSVVAGMSGPELGIAVLNKVYQDPDLPAPVQSFDKTAEYWAGWALADYQWASGRSFKDIFERVSFEDILSMYKVYHEMDISKFIDAMESKCLIPLKQARLKRLRENRGLSQSQLAEASGVPLRSIQLYEQRVNNIDKAQAHTVYRLARAIGCNVEDILEQPMNVSREDIALSLAGIIPPDMTLEEARLERLMTK